MIFDRNESVSQMEPLLIPDSHPSRPELMDLALNLVAESSKFKNSIPITIQHSLATIVRAMNCYYSNLIEGHNTHPIAIEQALQGHFDKDPKKRDLQLEAKAHIHVQEWIDEGGITGNIFSSNTLCHIHKRFCDLLPPDLLLSEDGTQTTLLRVTPGGLRETDVKVGNHIPISPGAIPRFLDRFDEVYSPLGKSETILALAASHHRLLWIHPFLDGNGRVARLMSHAAIIQALDTGGTWSIARGLARRVNEYKQFLSNCDLPRRNDLDGRGNLSQEELIRFTRFFLETCLDQVKFMETLMEPKLLRTRILLWAKEEVAMGHLPPPTTKILEAILYRGEIARSELSEILEISERHVRRSTSLLIEKGIITSNSPKSPFILAFPSGLAHRWMPGLFPSP